MVKLEEVIKNYQTLNSCGRLCLFLQYPDFREEFTEMERRETGPTTEHKTKPGLMRRIKAALSHFTAASAVAGRGGCC